jgi:hypothetical protein
MRGGPDRADLLERRLQLRLGREPELVRAQAEMSADGLQRRRLPREQGLNLAQPQLARDEL